MLHDDSSMASESPAAVQLSSFHDWFAELYKASPSEPQSLHETEWEDEDGTEEIHQTSFEKFPHLPLELQRIVISHAVKDLARQSLQSKRILVGDPADYSPYRWIPHSDQSLSELRAVNSFFKREVEQLLFRDNIVVFNMFLEASVFEQNGIGAHPWLANQSAKILEEVREIYVVALPHLPDPSAYKADQGLMSEEILESHETQLLFRFCDAMQERLPNLQRITVKFDIIFPVDAIVFEAEQVKQLKAAFTQRICVPGRLRQFRLALQTPKEADAEIEARVAAIADDLRRNLRIKVDGENIPSYLHLEW